MSEKPQYIALEAQVRDFWKSNGIFERSLQKNSSKGEYVFYDGPPFATGTPHYGHIVASLMKDVVPRFWTMNGFKVERKWGWDCHGLPIENLVEKELGITNKRQIIEMGVDTFNEACRSKVLSYVDDWKDMVYRLGRFVDMENDYKTLDPSFMESVWWVFKQLYDKGLVYEGYRSMYICPRCETTLSQSEVSEGYKDIKDLSVVAKFELVDEPGTFLVAWTTTPWTLPGNVALAVNPKMEYIKVDTGTEKIIISKSEHDRKNAETKIIATLKGSDLVGKAYKPLFDYYATDETLENKVNGWKVYPADFVIAEEGTGIVHIAPAFGEDDMALGKEKNLPFVQHVGMDGIMKEQVKDFAGLHVKPIEDVTATDVAIIKYLAAHGLLFAKEKYEHSYPHCWRCDTPLINYATSSWFVAVSKFKDTMLKTAQDINWSPDYIKEGRFGNWLEGARDWSISRQRFWASVIPLWRCDDCRAIKVFGSIKELEEASGQSVTDLHKHIVDKIELKCECGKMMKRIPDVLDTWFDSGSMPYAQMHYPFENKERFEKNFPAEFIAEGIDQTRCWFYYMHLLATALENKPAFKNVIVNGIVLAEDGKKMSKKLNNYPDPNIVFDTYGADALRAFLLSAPVMQAENMNFSEKGVEESLRKNVMLIWNVFSFYSMYQADEKASSASENILDKWIIAKLNQLIATVTKAMHEYNLPRGMRAITEFIDEFSTWYLRRSRDRFKTEGEDKQRALETMKYVFIELSKVMAPFMPFTAEGLWQKVSGFSFLKEDASVHLETWPMAMDVDAQIIKDMELVRRIVEMGLAARDAEKIKIRQPLQKITVHLHQGSGGQVPDDFISLIQDELNIKEVLFTDADEEKVQLDIVLTPELEREGLKREIVRLVNGLRKNNGLTIQDRIVLSWSSDDELVIKTLEEYGDDIKTDVLATEIKMEKAGGMAESKINNKIINLIINKV